MPKITLPAALAAALVALTAGEALAGRLATMPLAINGTLQCSLAYLGQQPNTPVTVRIVHPAGVIHEQIVKMGPNRRVAWVKWDVCSAATHPSQCNPMACVFETPAPNVDIAAGAVVITPSGATREVQAR